MTPAGKFYDPDTRPRRPRDVGLPLPSKAKARHEIAVGDVVMMQFGLLANNNPDRGMGKVLAVYTEWVIIQRASGAWWWVNKQRRWEVVDSKEFREKAVYKNLEWERGTWKTPDGKEVPFEDADITHLFDIPKRYEGYETVITIRRWPKKVVFQWNEFDNELDINGDSLYIDVAGDNLDEPLLMKHADYRGGTLHTTNRYALERDFEGELNKARAAFTHQFKTTKWASAASNDYAEATLWEMRYNED